MGPATEAGWTGTGGRRENAVLRVKPPSPRKNGPRLKDRRDGTSRGVAVCLCFSAIREISRGCYPRCAFRRSASLSYRRERGFLKLPLTRRDLRAAMTLGRKKERMNTPIAGLTIMTAVVISTPPGTSGLLALDGMR